LHPIGCRLYRSPATTHPILPLSTFVLPGKSGLNVVRALRLQNLTMFIIMLTGWGSIATAQEAVRGGADHYLSKPVDADQIIAAYKSRSGSVQSEDPSHSIPSLARVEWEHVQRVLSDCGGNISLAARLLGLHRRSLQRKLSKYPPRV
jgi:two-component system response regulator RegA